MPKNQSTAPTGNRFVIAGLLIELDREASFRYCLTCYGIKVLSATRIRAHEICFVISVPNATSLWQFIARHLGPDVNDVELNKFLADHVTPVSFDVALN